MQRFGDGTTNDMLRGGSLETDLVPRNLPTHIMWHQQTRAQILTCHLQRAWLKANPFTEGLSLSFFICKKRVGVQPGKGCYGNETIEAYPQRS